MLGYSTLVEQYISKANGYLAITYQCSNCKHNITFPEQQGFNYCYLCGAKILRVKSGNLTWNPLIKLGPI